MQTLTTRVLPATGRLGERIRVEASSGLRSCIYREAALPGHTTHQKHEAAAMAFATSLGWKGNWVAGHAGSGLVFVNAKDPDAGFLLV